MKYISKKSLKNKLVILTSSVGFLVALLCYVFFHFGVFTNFGSLFNSNYSIKNQKNEWLSEKKDLAFELNISKKRYDSLISENFFLKESILS
jgi:predicted PurR-regulated permease PerM